MIYMQIRSLSICSTGNTLLASSWTCPPAGMVKINVDPHVVPDSYIGLGIVARGANWQLMWATVKRVEVLWDVEVAKSTSVRFVL